MKFRFLSRMPHRQHGARRFGAMLLIIGFLIRGTQGASDLQIVGFLLLFWSVLSSFLMWAKTDEAHPDQEPSVWVHLGGLLIFLMVGAFATMIIVKLNGFEGHR